MACEWVTLSGAAEARLAALEQPAAAESASGRAAGRGGEGGVRLRTAPGGVADGRGFSLTGGRACCVIVGAALDNNMVPRFEEHCAQEAS
jgi:hypothetical protein